MRKLLVISIISLFVLVACTTTEAPIEPVEALALEQNFSAVVAGGNLSVDYPAGWAVGGEFVDFGITIATSEELATGPFDGTAEAGEVYIEILYSPESSFEGDTVSVVLQEIVDSIDNPEGTISDITTATFNGKEAAYVTLDSEEDADGMFLVVDSGDAYSTIVVAFADGALAQHQASIEAIAGSIQYGFEAEVTPEATEASE